MLEHDQNEYESSFHCHHRLFYYSLSDEDLHLNFSVLASIILTLQILFLLGSVVLFVNGSEPEVQKKVITRLYMKNVWRDMRM